MEDMHHSTEDIRKSRREPRRDEGSSLLREANAKLFDALRHGESLESTRQAVYAALERAESRTFLTDRNIHPLENAIVRECVRNLRRVIAPISEKATETSALNGLRNLARGEPSGVTYAFLMEFVALFSGVAGDSGIYRDDRQVKANEAPDFIKKEGREAAMLRTLELDKLGEDFRVYSRRYPSGLEPDVINRRQRNRDRILEYFGATKADWNDARWHQDHVITTPEVLFDLVEVTDASKEAMRIATKNKLPVGMTPYYVSLMEQRHDSGLDDAIRSLVIPPEEYVDALSAERAERKQAFDFMGEQDTSPIDLITRRYPSICILKPYNTCAQICVYCQRNWEIDRCLDPNAKAANEAIDNAIDWIGQHPQISDVLITGGDPAVMSDDELDEILSKVASMKQVHRIRLGTRTPVVLPFRWTEALADTLAKYHEPGRREVAVVTHFEHPYEVTPEARDAVQLIKQRSMGVYNQQVFTIYNSRRFETAKLRRDLRLIGVDPYYTFNMKGKQETERYMVPIARILQERKEEARLLPGLDRTDEPVFNVPRLGKHHLRAVDDRQLIMIKPGGERVYQFLPWEKNIAAVPTYNYVDIPVMGYLERLEERGESSEEYKTIWYYY